MQTRVVHISASTHGDKFRASFGCGYGEDAPLSKNKCCSERTKENRKSVGIAEDDQILRRSYVVLHVTLEPRPTRCE